MTLAEGQVSVGAPGGPTVVMGAGTRYRLLGFNPLEINNRADQTQKRVWSPGSVGGAEWREEVIVPFSLRIHGTSITEWMDMQWDLREAFDAIEDSPVDHELRFALGGREYLMYGRPRSFGQTLKRLRTGKVVGEAAFAALDPRIYSATEEIRENLALPQQSGGLTFPVTFPIVFGGVYSGGLLQLEHIGRLRRGAPMIFTVTGPVVQPRISITDPDGTLHTLRVLSTLAAGETLVLDTGSHTAYLNGTAARRNEVTGDWPLLKRGLSELRWTAASFSSTARLAVRWRHVW